MAGVIIAEVERPSVCLAGQWWACSRTTPDGGSLVSLAVPLDGGRDYVGVAVRVPSTWHETARRMVASVAATYGVAPGAVDLVSPEHNPYDVSTPTVAGPLDDVLTTLGGFLGGPGGAAIGRRLAGALGDDAGAPRPRPGNLPAEGSAQNLRRILTFLDVRDSDTAADVRARLERGIAQDWDPADDRDAQRLLSALASAGSFRGTDDLVSRAMGGDGLEVHARLPRDVDGAEESLRRTILRAVDTSSTGQISAAITAVSTLLRSGAVDSRHAANLTTTLRDLVTALRARPLGDARARRIRSVRARARSLSDVLLSGAER